MEDQVPATERAARLLVDLLGIVHEAILAAALESEKSLNRHQFCFEALML